MSNTNRELQLVGDFVRYTGSNIFLTGKAGTGKTTFLHGLKEQTPKRLIITAPTGVAAMNAGGVTLHSFFQLPFGPHIPGSDSYERNSQRQFRFSKEKKQIIQSLDLLVIDEISMVRADLLDGVDAVLRRYRYSNEPFGGVQLLMIGDLHQLSPVAKPHEWQLLKQHYDSVYFFSCKALQQTKLLSIELKHIYRQSDEDFIKILNSVRENRLDPACLGELNSRHIEDFQPDEEQGYITLTTHNASAESINQKRLTTLDGKKFIFNAKIKGEFPEHIFPTLPKLTLKKGAQVMFVRNDQSSEKLYYNGKIGKVTAIIGKTVFVLCPGDTEEIEVDPVDWDNIKYTINNANQEIEEEIVGKFSQYPLKLAWAITIHKSQGLTFERAIIDAQAAFAHGQVYVALSRCKTLEGLVLSAPIAARGVATDGAVLAFDKHCQDNQPNQELLHQEKINYQQKLLFDCFDFALLSKRLGYLVHLLISNARIVQVTGASDMAVVETEARQHIFGVAENFRNQLYSIFESRNLPETDGHVLERIAKASAWFQGKFKAIFDDSVQTLHFETDNKELRKRIQSVLNNCRKEIAIKYAGICSCEKGFSPTDYLHKVAEAEINFQPETRKKKQAPAFSESDIEHPVLFEALRDWRTAKASELDVARFLIMHQRVLIQITVRLPESLTELSKISGVGKKTLENYGKDIVEVVSAYRKKEGIETVTLPTPRDLPFKTEQSDSASSQKGNSKEISLELFRAGQSVTEIAAARGFAQTTIESHLSTFVETGEIPVEKFVAEDKQEKIKQAIATAEEPGLKAIKLQLGDEYSYTEIKMMVAHERYCVAEKGD